VALEVLRRDQGCIAPRLGGSYHDCWGRNRIEHVKADPRAGKRAEACVCRLVTLCEGHTEPGMRAGYVWATDRRNRQACRDYLADKGYGPHADHADGYAMTRAVAGA
jgi:hypothetical protein